MSFHSIYRTFISALPSDVEVMGLDLVGNSTIAGHRKNRPKGFLLAAFNYAYIAARILTTSSRKILFREFNNYAIGTIVWLANLRNIEVWFLVNHNFSGPRAENSTPLRRIESRFISLEDPRKVDSLRAPYAFFPIHSVAKRSYRNKGAIVIGLVGRYREEKNFESIFNVLELLLSSRPGDFSIKVGSNIDYRPKNLRQQISFSNTSSKDSYDRFIESCDIVIFNYGKSYEFRTSGVVFDCISLGSIPFVPGFEFLRMQVSWPSTVGRTFLSYDDLFQILADLSWSDIQELRDNLSFYANGRSPLVLRESLRRVFNQIS